MSANTHLPPPRLQLKGLDFVTHYGLPLYLLMPSVTAVWCLLTHHYVPSAIPGMRLILLLTLPCSGFFGWYQARALRFRQIKTSSNAHDNYLKVSAAIHRAADWTIRNHHADSLIVATVPGFPLTWGERVEVRFHGSDVFVNSICDPSKWFGVFSWGRNGANMRFICHAVADI
jgi:hypothetical protein